MSSFVGAAGRSLQFRRARITRGVIGPTLSQRSPHRVEIHLGGHCQDPHAPERGHGLAARGNFGMGCERFYPEEAPVRQAALEGFWIDRHPVTVREYHAFVRETGHQTLAERAPTQEEYPDGDPDLLVAGSLVFKRPRGPVPLDDHRRWWAYVPGADWRHPEGPAAPLSARGRHPVTHVAWEDAAAYASGRARSCPPRPSGSPPRAAASTAACSPWGDHEKPGGQLMANHWRAHSRTTTPGPPAGWARRRSRRSRRTATGSTT